jgi:hypothetical protein
LERLKPEFFEIYTLGYPGFRTAQLLQEFKKVDMKKIDHVIILGGTNDLGGVDTESIWAKSRILLLPLFLEFFLIFCNFVINRVYFTSIFSLYVC